MDKEIIVQIFALAASSNEVTYYPPTLYGLSSSGRLFIKPYGETDWALMNNGIREVGK